jgi:uncharacterized glyoxalase superfamily protein PhnB
MASKLPTDWPRISSCLFYDEAATAIEWLCKAYGFELRLKVDGENGDIVHSELDLGSGRIMVGSAKKSPERKSPKALDGVNTQGLFVYVEDIQAHCDRARAAGAKIVSEPTTVDYGEDYWSDRGYEAVDPEGHRWYFAERLRSKA